MLEAHLEAYRVIHDYYDHEIHQPVWVSIAKHMSRFTPFRKKHLPDRLAAFLRHVFFNRLCFDALTSGFLFFPGIFCENLSGSRALDFLGVNYYTRDFIRFKGICGEGGIGEIGDREHHPEFTGDINQMGWETYPEGLYDLLMDLGRYRLPVILCENGICAREDAQRERYIRGHLEALMRAKQKGVPVMGYLYWSLLDNFEWAHGYEPRFGIVHVDYQTKIRKIRPSAYVLTEICRKLGTDGTSHPD